MSNSEQVGTTEVDQGKPVEGVVPIRFKRAIQAIGLLLMIVGLPIAINLFCIVPLVSFSGSGSDATIYGVVSLTVALLTLGAGGAAFLHAQRSLQNKISKPLRLPLPILFVGAFLLLIGLGLIISEDIFFTFYCIFAPLKLRQY